MRGSMSAVTVVMASLMFIGYHMSQTFQVVSISSRFSHCWAEAYSPYSDLSSIFLFISEFSKMFPISAVRNAVFHPSIFKSNPVNRQIKDNLWTIPRALVLFYKKKSTLLYDRTSLFNSIANLKWKGNLIRKIKYN